MLKGTIESVFPDVRRRLGIPDNHKIGYAMLFGKPAVEYRRTVERGRANLIVSEWKAA